MGLRSRAPDVVCLGALLVFIAGLCLVPITETDLFFRLKVGQEIWARHGLLAENLFSFTAPHHPDLDAAWAFEVALAGLHHAGGFPAIVLAKTGWLCLVFGASYGLCRRRGSGPTVTLGVLASAAFVMSDRFVERPHLVSFAGEVAVVSTLSTLHGPWSLRRVMGFGAGMCAWANAHAGVFVAVFMLSLHALGSWPHARPAARRALALAVLAGAATLATPLGFGIVRYWLLHLRIPRLHPVDEFRSATWRSDAGYFIWIAAVCGSLAVNRLRCRGWWRTPPEGGAAVPARAAWAEWLPAAGVVGLGLASVRFAADAVLVTAPLLAQAWHWGRGARAGERSPARHGTPFAAALVVLAVVVLQRLAAHPRGRPWLDLGVEPELIPTDALHFVERHGLREHMYNDYELGSYLAFEGFPRYRVFVDPRLPAYPLEMHRLLGRFDIGRAEWSSAMVRYGVDSALLTDAGINRRVAWWDPELWALVYRQSNARVFVRRQPRWRDMIARFEIPATFAFTIETGTATLPLLEPPAASPVPACVWQQRLGDLLFELDQGRGGRARNAYRRALDPPACLPAPDEARLAAWLGRLELSEGQLESSVARLSRALALVPEDGLARASRAEALERLGRVGEARQDWEHVARLAEDPRLATAARNHLLRLDPGRPPP